MSYGITVSEAVVGLLSSAGAPSAATGPLLQPLLAAAGMGPIVGGIVAGWLVILGLLLWRRPAGIAAAGAGGLGVSLYLGRQHHPSAGSSFCSVDDVFNCDVVNRSEYSELFGLPIAFLGAGFYAACLFVGVMLLREPAHHKRGAHVVVAGGVLAVLYSAFLAWASSQLGSWCLFCISLYGVNALLLAGGLLAAKDSGEPLGSGLVLGLLGKDDRSIGGMLGAGVLAVVLSMFWYRSLGGEAPGGRGADGAPADLSALMAPMSGPLTLDGTEPIDGNPSAKYTVVEFADFECPHCGKVAPQLHKLVTDHPEVRVLFKHYPLSNLCNEAISNEFHKDACGAARAAECARVQGKFWEMDRVMFMNQQFLAAADLKLIAGQVGLDLPAYEACMASPESELAVKADAQHGNAAGVNGTPAMFISGLFGPGEFVFVPGGPEDLDALIRAHKGGAALKKPAGGN
ncbi:MAG: thioredoxin domain-containing protein [Deltaproteobacteria bacterium]|jgi:protein-disulfide isomerase/uncharacterized membrane protein|nr:thioredoxin domain-containing protein [Deltaproteobacteria bacterium]